MSLRMSTLRGRRILAKDGPAGVLNDLYFDDRGRGARYLVIDSGDRRPGRRLLRAASASLDEGAGAIVLRLTCEQVKRSIAADPDPHLFSGREVSGYSIHAADGSFGLVEDIVVESDWSIAGLVLWSGDWLLPGRHVEVAGEALETIDRAARSVRLRLTREQIRRAPRVG